MQLIGQSVETPAHHPISGPAQVAHLTRPAKSRCAIHRNLHWERQAMALRPFNGREKRRIQQGSPTSHSRSCGTGTWKLNTGFIINPSFPKIGMIPDALVHVGGKNVWRLNALWSTRTITFCRHVLTRSFICSWRMELKQTHKYTPVKQTNWGGTTPNKVLAHLSLLKQFYIWTIKYYSMD